MHNISSPPLPVGAWRGYMVNHPDNRFAKYIVCGLSEGFRSGFDHSHRTRPSNRNMKSAGVNKSVVSGYVAEEMQRTRLLASLSLHPGLSVSSTPQHKQKFSLKSMIKQCVGALCLFPHQLAIGFVLELVNSWTKLHQ